MQPLLENGDNVPAFLNKLWWMVNDSSTDHLISWGSRGKSFIIQNQHRFWYELLPVYYKHNNMSSFVRQLNMYGFHKMSSTENGLVDNAREEIQFLHPYFQKEKPELLKLIKRKVTVGKAANSTSVQNNIKSDDLNKILSDVKYLRGRQANVDSQLSTIKQENAVLWRELAMLRQKYMKQQQIVNKLIQFLVTIVQPNTRMGGFGVKRRYPLMLSECPQAKKNKKQPTKGPTIHELDNSENMPDEIFAEEKDDLLRTSNLEPIDTQEKSKGLLAEVYKNINLNSELSVESPEYDLDVDQNTNPLVDELLSHTEVPTKVEVDNIQKNTKQDNLDSLDQSQDLYSNNEKIFLNSRAPDTLLTNLINGNYNSDLLNKENIAQLKKENYNDLSDLAVAKLECGRLNPTDDLGNHEEKAQSELDQLKDILHGWNSLDANALLGLFNDGAPDYGLTYQQNADDSPNKLDSLVPGSELTTYNTGLVDFNQLFDDISEPQDILKDHE